jgi:SAM-dependent methyltransferase
MIHNILEKTNIYPTSKPITTSDLETTFCPLCDSGEKSILHTFKPFNVVACKDCGLMYLNPRLKESVMKRIYQGTEYFLHGGKAGYKDYISQEKGLRATFRRFLEELKRQGMASGRLLEVGCGYGYFLDEARNFFSYRAGTELSEEAGSYARRLSGADVYIGDIGLLPPGFNNFDIIVIINVIEHIYTPIEFLLSLRQRLKYGGRIVVATPDIGSFWYKAMKRRWPSFKIPEHIAFYTEKTLTILLQKTGFRDIKQIPFSHAFPFGLITSKLGINIRGKISEIPIWVPKTMVALSA